MGKLHKIVKIILTVFIVVSLFFIYQLKNLRFDYDFEAFFGNKEQETIFFNEHRNRFETDNDFIFLSIEREKGIYDYEFLTNISNLVDSLAKYDLVRSVNSLTHLNEYVKSSFSPIVIKNPYLHICDTCDIAADSSRIISKPEIFGYFINKNQTGLLLHIKHEEYLGKEKCDRLKSHIESLLAYYDLPNYRIGGRAIGQSYYIDKMMYEMAFFISLSFVLIIIFLIITFKSWWGVWIPLVIVTGSMIWIVGFMAWIGEPINLILTVLPSIIFVVAMSDVIHLKSKYIEELRLGKSKKDAVNTAYKEVGLATLLTSITTSIGFLSLLTVPLQPVQVFGVYISIGVCIAFILAYTVLPSLFILTKEPKLSKKRITQNFWYQFLHKNFLFVIKNYKKIGLISFVLIGICIYGTTKMESNYFLLEDLKKDNPARRNFDYFNEEYMGLRPFEMSIFIKDESKSAFDFDVLQEINKIDSFLINDYGLKQTFSIISVLKMANRTEHGGQSKYYQFPHNESEINGFLKNIKKFDKENQLLLLIDSTEKYIRISSTQGDDGKYKINERNEKLYDFINQNINQDLLEIRLTGTGHLLDKNMSLLSFNLARGLIFAVLVVSLLMGFLYKSVKMVLLALVPNLFPLIVLAAFMALTGIDLKVSTAIIFTISFGIAVDDTIHFMSKFKLELGKNKSFLYALKRTYLSTGRAIILTTLILCSGFLLLIFSDFLGTFYIGLLISLSLLFALIADLYVLPVLLLLFFKKGVIFDSKKENK